ncbi:AI-2E family transporter [Salsipaludibacter albus]|uniref:AI-2E family transporter n=1 Tax=Salsipaludibacter albus TaxID=2849650 RepID=UPI001EE48EA7|nr:AI-2E family transporter [Salsipaludibacter albus]MBY5161808.1 AI-2E family transporter [Salsipaludibacter albus]
MTRATESDVPDDDAPATDDRSRDVRDAPDQDSTAAAGADRPADDAGHWSDGLPFGSDTTDPDARGIAQEVVVVPWRRWRPRLIWTLVLGIAGGWLLAGLASAFFGRVRPILISITVALFVSFALEPAVKWMSQRGMSRGLATGIVFLVSTIAFVGFLAAMVPLIVSQVATLVESGPEIVDSLSSQAQNLPWGLGDRAAEWIAGLQQDLPNRLPDFASSASRGALNVGASVGGALFNLLTIALVAFYLAADGPRFRRVLSSNMRPGAQREFLEVWEIAVEKTGGYLYGRVLTAVASAVFHTIVFLVIGLDYAFALGAWVGVISSVIPVVGTYLAGILPIVIALASSFGQAIWVLVAIVVYQQVENLVVVPRITGQTVELHPAVAFIAVLMGAALLGAVGALLAIPTAAIVAALWSARKERHDVVDHHLTNGDLPRSGEERT